MFFEEAGEVLEILEAEGLGSLSSGEATDQQTLGTADKEALNDLCGTLARNISHHITKIAGRQAEFGGAIFHVGKAVLTLQAPVVVVGEHTMESRQQVGLLADSILKLTLIEQLRIVAGQQNVVLKDAVGLRRLTAVLYETPDHPHQLP